MAGALAVPNKGSYGAFELKRLYPKYYTLGLTAAVAVHLLVLVIYFLSGSERNVVEKFVPKEVKEIDLDKFKAPSLLPNIPDAGALISPAAKRDGIPVPVDDEKAEPDATIKTTVERRDADPLGKTLSDGDILKVKEIPAIIEPPEILPGENEFVPVEKLPELIVAPKPEYPAVAIKAGIIGKVHVKILVSKEGKVLKGFIFKSDSELLNQAALDVAVKSVFTPAIQNNHPVAVWIVMNYNFNLRDQ